MVPANAGNRLMPHLDPVPGVLDFEGPPVPFSGRTRETRHASYTGAVHATLARGEKVAALLQLVRNHGPITMQEIAGVTGWPISSVCSLLDAVRDELETDGFERVEWSDGRTTKRTRWRVRA